jgi:hypothetical protein
MSLDLVAPLSLLSFYVDAMGNKAAPIGLFQ